jgi:serine/threonine-protein kinase
MVSTSAPRRRSQRIVLGRYALGPVIGRGGMSTIYEGTDRRSGKHVAVKVLAPHLSEDPQSQRRLLNEAEAIRRLPHPHIVRLIDSGVAGNGEHQSVVLVMDLVRGETLGQRLTRDPLPVTEAIEIARQIADALDLAHRRGVIHRDVKPANVLLAAGTNRPRALLADFGIARAADCSTTLTATGLVMGSAPYIAPELLQGGAADARSDVYALGVMLFQSLTGRLPFEAATAAAALSRRLVEDPPPVNTYRPEVSGWLAATISRMLARDPGLRFQSAAEAAAALRGTAGLLAARVTAPPWSWVPAEFGADGPRGPSAAPLAPSASTRPLSRVSAPLPDRRAAPGGIASAQSTQWTTVLPLLALLVAFLALAAHAAAARTPSPQPQMQVEAAEMEAEAPAAATTPTDVPPPEPTATIAPTPAISPAPPRPVAVVPVRGSSHRGHGRRHDD